MIEIGKEAPDFTLPDKNGEPVTLSRFRGGKVVLYFYPKDNTPGCTRQACAFSARYGEFKKRGIEVVGVSRDSAASHLKFAEKFSLPFIILSDPDLEVIKKYGVWKEKKLYGKTSFGVVRTTFVIGEDGKIERVMEKVKPDTNADEILAALGGGKDLVIDAFSHELSGAVEPFVSAELSADEKSVAVTYLSGNGYTEITETFDLSDPLPEAQNGPSA
ncbi:MAG: thioredoxin-dependent thiol peroxidase [Clostridia bacterium]|nr:thioredoxin-dependent thiol peroxidase [Clostridia bacterium]MBQ7475034.1 thioredoxin-dependent thiol peroxidase [Clostridia bacterium]